MQPGKKYLRTKRGLLRYHQGRRKGYRLRREHRANKRQLSCFAPPQPPPQPANVNHIQKICFYFCAPQNINRNHSFHLFRSISDQNKCFCHCFKDEIQFSASNTPLLFQMRIALERKMDAFIKKLVPAKYHETSTVHRNQWQNLRQLSLAQQHE